MRQQLNLNLIHKGMLPARRKKATRKENGSKVPRNHCHSGDMEVENDFNHQNTSKMGGHRMFGAKIINGVPSVKNTKIQPTAAKQEHSQALTGSKKEVQKIESNTQMIVEQPTLMLNIKPTNPPNFPYQESIISYIGSLERKDPKIQNPMSIQTEVNLRMREILVSWMIQTHFKMNMNTQSLFLAVNILDRVLSKIIISRTKFQLLGLTSLYLACKYEEVKYHGLSKFIVMCSYQCTGSSILQLQSEILLCLEFNLNIISPLYILEDQIYLNETKESTSNFAKYLLELSLISHHSLKYNSNIFGLAALHLAELISQGKKRNYGKMLDLLKFDVSQRDKCSKQLMKIYNNRNSPIYEKVNKKYGCFIDK